MEEWSMDQVLALANCLTGLPGERIAHHDCDHRNDILKCSFISAKHMVLTRARHTHHGSRLSLPLNTATSLYAIGPADGGAALHLAALPAAPREHLGEFRQPTM